MAGLTIPRIRLIDGTPMTTSRAVSKFFGRRHDDVLRRIKSLECSASFTARNFTVSEYKDGSGKKNPEYLMTKDGFVFLVMGFTGKKAAQFKEAYIAAFNQMQAKALAAPAAKTPAPLSDLQARAVQRWVEQRVRASASGRAGYIRLWGGIKQHFKVDTYRQVEADRFGELRDLVLTLPLTRDDDTIDPDTVPPLKTLSASPAYTEETLLLWNHSRYLMKELEKFSQSLFKLSGITAPPR